MSLDQLLHSSTMHAVMCAFDVPGMAAAIVDHHGIVAARGYGTCALGDSTPVDQHTRFAVGSISKSITATALALLVDEGRLQWDDRVIEFLPSLQWYDPYVTHEITVRDLLTHQTGLPPISGGTIWYGSSHSRADVLRRMRYLQPASSFRSRFAYQNTTYLVAGEIAASITGRSWDQVIRERIFAPLNMTSSTTCLAELAHVDHVATPHARIDGKLQPLAHRSYDNVAPAASIYSSVVDLAHYLRLYLNAGVLDGQPMIAASTIDELTTPQTVMPADFLATPVTAFKPIFLTYGLGWIIRDYRGQKLVLHAGGVDGMRALAAMLPDHQLGVVVLTNAEELLTAAVVYNLLDVLLDAPLLDWCAAYRRLRDERAAQQARYAQQIDAARVRGTQPSSALEQYAGRYHDPLYGDAQIALEADRLVLRFSHTPSFTADLEHWQDDTFRLFWRDPLIPPGLLRFTFVVHGKITRLTFDQPKLLDVDFSELNLVKCAT